MATNKGYIVFPRDFYDLWEWQAPRVYSYAEAWLDQLGMASFVERVVPTDDGGSVALERGEIYTTQRRLAKRWGWSTSKVSRYLHRLAEVDGRVEMHDRCIVVDLARATTSATTSVTTSATTVSVLRLSNYERYCGCLIVPATPSTTTSATTSATTINKDIIIQDNNTHTQYDCLVRYFAGACEARTSADAEVLRDAARELTQLIARNAEAQADFVKLDILTRRMVDLWATYPKLQMAFAEPLDKRGLATLMQNYEWEDVVRIVSAMANKVPTSSANLASFYITFRSYATADHVIRRKAELGNTRYTNFC